jgi:hypothetical protein
MANDSIFNRVVRTEDAYTQLLCNLMQRNDEFRERVLGLFLSSDLPSKIGSYHIRTQAVLPECGRPDVIIEAPGIFAVVEVKVSLKRSLTVNQRPTPCDVNEITGYSGFIRKHLAGDRFLVFLVPRGWEYCEEVQDAINQLSRGDPDVKGKVIYWEQILGVASTMANPDPFLDDFSRLLQRFALMTFSTEEVERMYSKGFPIRDMLKLQNLVQQIGKRAKKKYTVKFSQDSGESGFYLTNGDNWFFWCGIWVDACEQEGLPLTFGVTDQELGKMPTLLRAFQEVYTERTKSIDGYTVGSVPQEMLEGDDAVDNVWKRLEPIMDKVNRAAQTRA